MKKIILLSMIWGIFWAHNVLAQSTFQTAMIRSKANNVADYMAKMTVWVMAENTAPNWTDCEKILGQPLPLQGVDCQVRYNQTQGDESPVIQLENLNPELYRELKQIGFSASQEENKSFFAIKMGGF